MKSEKQIRAHLADLLAYREQVADTAGTPKNVIRWMMVDDSISYLKWVLGENPEWDAFVEKIAADVRR